MWATRHLADTVLDDGDVSVCGGKLLLRANKCFERGVCFSNLPAGAQWTGRGPKVGAGECWGTGQVISDGERWGRGYSVSFFKLAGHLGPPRRALELGMCVIKGQEDFGGQRERDVGRVV